MELVVAEAAAVVAVLVSPVVPASYVDLTIRRHQRRLLPPLMQPATSSRMPISPTTRTVPLSDHMLRTQIMDMLNWRPRSSSSPSLFRYTIFYVPARLDLVISFVILCLHFSGHCKLHCIIYTEVLLFYFYLLLRVRFY